MGIKVEGSPWQQGATDGRQCSTASQMDFRAKLTRQDSQQQSADDFARTAADRQLDHDLSRSQASAAKLEDTATLNTVTTEIMQPGQQHQAKLAQVLELYSLGALAGHHLSHVPQYFADDKAFTAVVEPAAPSALSSSLHIASVAEGAFLQPPMDAHAQMNSVPAESPQTEASQERLQQVRMLGKYLASKWPQRQIQVLLRGGGIELVIRDYHLALEGAAL